MPDISGNSCTAPVNSACCVSPSAGGNPRSARISRLQALPRRRRRPICRWCEHPGPVPGRCPRRSGPGTGATVRATVLSPGASALGTSCCAHQPSPTATPPSPALSPSYPSPSPLSLLPVLTLCLPDSSRPKCGFHLGFGLGRDSVDSALCVVRVFGSLGHGVVAAALEPVTLAVHLQDVDVVGEPVQQCSGEPF